MSELTDILDALVIDCDDYKDKAASYNNRHMISDTAQAIEAHYQQRFEAAIGEDELALQQNEVAGKARNNLRAEARKKWSEQ